MSPARTIGMAVLLVACQREPRDGKPPITARTALPAIVHAPPVATIPAPPPAHVAVTPVPKPGPPHRRPRPRVVSSDDILDPFAIRTVNRQDPLQLQHPDPMMGTVGIAPARGHGTGAPPRIAPPHTRAKRPASDLLDPFAVR